VKAHGRPLMNEHLKDNNKEQLYFGVISREYLNVSVENTACRLSKAYSYPFLMYHAPGGEN
jgi:hypothetical protein